MPNITDGQLEVTPRRTTPLRATMADDAVSMAISACELVDWRDLASELEKVRQQTAARRRQIERG